MFRLNLFFGCFEYGRKQTFPEVEPGRRFILLVGLFAQKSGVKMLIAGKNDGQIADK